MAHGELDGPASVELRDTIAKATGELEFEPGHRPHATSGFMPSPAIGVLASAQAMARRNGAEITLVAPPGSVAARILTICALDYVTTLGD